MTENDENKMIFLFDAAEKVAEIFSKCMSLDVSITGIQISEESLEINDVFIKVKELK